MEKINCKPGDWLLMDGGSWGSLSYYVGACERLTDKTVTVVDYRWDKPSSARRDRSNIKGIFRDEQTARDFMKKEPGYRGERDRRLQEARKYYAGTAASFLREAAQ